MDNIVISWVVLGCSFLTIIFIVYCIVYFKRESYDNI